MILALAAAATFQDLPSLDRAVTAFTGHPAGAEGGARAPVDPRLRLASCPTVVISWRTPAQDAVVVSCAGPDWRLFVPVLRTVPITAGTGIAALPVAIRAEPVIRRGDPVVIEAGSDGFAVTREGVAAGDAAPGARIVIKVEGASQPVQAIAIANGRVTLPGWAQ